MAMVMDTENSKKRGTVMVIDTNLSEQRGVETSCHTKEHDFFTRSTQSNFGTVQSAIFMDKEFFSIGIFCPQRIGPLLYNFLDVNISEYNFDLSTSNST